MEDKIKNIINNKKLNLVFVNDLLSINDMNEQMIESNNDRLRYLIKYKESVIKMEKSKNEVNRLKVNIMEILDKSKPDYNIINVNVMQVIEYAMTKSILFDITYSCPNKKNNSKFIKQFLLMCDNKYNILEVKECENDDIGVNNE
jgi:hypothetical protein